MARERTVRPPPARPATRLAYPPDPVESGPGFAVAVAQPRAGRVRVHLIGALGPAALATLTTGLPELPVVPAAAGVTLEFDLSALTHVDDASLSALVAYRATCAGRGWTVEEARPHGRVLALLDQAARAGWSPPDLSCTEILHWHRNPSSPARTPGRSHSGADAS